MIKPVCEKFYGVKRHKIGIFPDDRAVMSFQGRQYAVNFDSLGRLVGNGTDVVFVEKQGTVMKMLPFAEKVGLAFIDSQGFGSEYGIALATSCNQQPGVSHDYTDGFIPRNKGNLINLTDCDASDVALGIKINNAIRIGIDLNTIKEINDVNQSLDLRIEDLQEGVNPSYHYESLIGLLNNKGRLYEVSYDDRLVSYQEYLSQSHVVDGEEIQFIEWLKDNRIELNTVLAAAKPTAFWNWLKWKVNEVLPYRNYNRAIYIEDYMFTPTMNKCIEWFREQTKQVLENKVIGYAKYYRKFPVSLMM